VGYTITRFTASSDEEAVKKAEGMAWEGVYLERLDDASGRPIPLSTGE
jgi:hypothetical protein